MTQIGADVRPNVNQGVGMRVLIGRDDLSGAAVEAATAVSSGVDVEALAIRPVHGASKQFVNQSAIDVCELAIVTMLQAAAYGKPVALLPITALGRFQHQTLVTCKGLSVDELAGRSVGVRSWSQTTCVWLRGFLTEQYGLNLRDVDWIAYEDGHIAEYSDPSWVRRAPAGARLPADFLAGTVDYAILGNDLPEGDGISTAIADPDDVGLAWSRQKKFVPINHVIAISTTTAGAHAEAICAIYDALAELLAGARVEGAVDMNPVGFEALRGPVSLAATYAFEQEVLPRRVEFDELVSSTCEALGVSPTRLGG